MSDFDTELKAALSAEDKAFIDANVDEKGYYDEVFASLKGPGGVLNIMGWIAVFVLVALLIFFLVSAFQAETTRDQILFATLAMMANSGQMAFKLWLNMRMNRRALQIEIQKLKLAIVHQA